MTLLVSVPCPTCNDPIGFGMELCPSCGATISRDLRRNLEERLEATGGDYRVMRDRVREVAAWLGFVAAAQILFPMIFAVAGQRTWPSPFNFIVAGVMVVAALLVDRHPQKTIALAFVVWLGVEIIGGLVSPIHWVRGLVVKLILLLVLVRGFFAARTAERIRKQLAATIVEQRR